MYNETYLAHHGIKGMKWGVRRYQNEDGGLTAKGIKRYSGKHGAAKYIRDTNPAMQKRQKARRIGQGLIIGGTGALYGHIGYQAAGKDASVGKKIGSTAVGALIGSGLSALGAAFDNLGFRARDIREIEHDPAMVQQMDDARRYLRSQGINV